MNHGDREMAGPPDSEGETVVFARFARRQTFKGGRPAASHPTGISVSLWSKKTAPSCEAGGDVARDMVARAKLGQGGLDFAADRLGERAARVEAAAGRRRQRRGDVALQRG